MTKECAESLEEDSFVACNFSEKPGEEAHYYMGRISKVNKQKKSPTTFDIIFNDKERRDGCGIKDLLDHDIFYDDHTETPT
jgi:hypothetical protein